VTRLHELRSLVTLSRRFGQEPGHAILEEIQRLESDEQTRQIREAAIRARVAQDLDTIFQGVKIESGQQLAISAAADSRLNEEAQSVPAADDPGSESQPTTSGVPEATQQPTIADQVAKVIAEQGVVAPDPVLAQPQKDLEREIRYLREWIGRIAATGPGSGEVNLRYLDDVDRSTIEDNHYLRYNAPTKKFVFDHGNKNIYYGAFQSNVTQTSSATSATAMICEVTDFSRGVSMTSNGITSSISRIVIAHAGTYNLQFSAQFTNNGNASDRVNIWYRQNGVNAENSNSIVTVPSKDNANVSGAVIAGWNFFIRTNTDNEFIELMWWVEDETHTTIDAYPSQAATASSPYIPAVPSILITVNEVTIDNS